MPFACNPWQRMCMTEPGCIPGLRPDPRLPAVSAEATRAALGLKNPTLLELQKPTLSKSVSLLKAYSFPPFSLFPSFISPR
jgi:hypothetical protein